MSEGRTVHSVNDINVNSGNPAQSYQSVWMSHWKRTACNVTAEKHDPPCYASGNEELDYDSKDNHLSNELDILRSGKGLGVVETRTSKTMNDGWTMSTEIIGKGGLGSSVFKHNQEHGATKQAARPVAGHHLEQDQAVGKKRGLRVPSLPCEHDSSFRNGNFLDEGTSKNPLRYMNTTNSSAEGRGFSVLKPLLKTYVGSSSQVPCKLDLHNSGFDKGKSEVSSLIRKVAIVSNRQLQNTKLRVPEHGKCSKDIHSADLVCERTKFGPSQPDHSADNWYRERNTPFLFDISSASDHYDTECNGDFFRKMQKHSALCLSPDQYIDSGNTETRKSFYDCYSLNNLQNFNKVERMRICTTIEEGIRKGYPRISQTSHRFLMTDKTSVNMLNKCDVISNARVLKNIHENKPSALYSVPTFKNQGKGGVIIQPLSSSTDSEGKGNARDVKISKVTIKNNESSAETDPMDVDFLKAHSGANSTPSEKISRKVYLAAVLSWTRSRVLGVFSLYKFS